MGKWLKLFMAAAALAALFGCLPALAERSGTAGRNATWTLYDDGRLVIRGEGAIGDWDDPPWEGSNYDIDTIVIGNGITCLSFAAFSGSYNCTSVTIPDSVTYIDDCAFSNCYSLTEIVIPDGVTYIGGYAFGGCAALTDFVIPESVTTLGACVFDKCTALTSIVIPESVTVIGRKPFEGCTSLTSVEVAPGNPSYTSVDGVLYDKGITGIICYPHGRRERYAIPATIAKINDETFRNCKGLAGVAIPDGLTSIGSYAFYGCSGLTEITIPDSVTSIGSYAFYGCSGLKSVAVPGATARIGEYTFYGCTGLTSVMISDGVTRIDEYAFSGCGGLKRVVIPDSVTAIGGHAFSGCGALAEVTLPNGLTGIAEGLFSGCGCLMNATIPNGVTGIGRSAFSGCGSLANVELPDSVASIGASAFARCTALRRFRIPDGVISIGKGAFDRCDRLAAVEVSPRNTKYTSVDGVLYNKAVTSIVYYPCGRTGHYSIPDTVARIGDEALRDRAGLGSVTIPSGVTAIGKNAFTGCAGLTGVTIPDSVTSIGAYAFSDCVSLTDVAIPGSVITVGGYVFSGCAGLTSVTISDGVTGVADYAFAGCDSLSRVWWPATGDATIAANAFPHRNITFYCYEYSPLEARASDMGFGVALIDGFDPDNGIEITCGDIPELEAGTAVKLPCSVFPDLPGTVTYTCDDPSVGTVAGDGVFAAIAPGTANVTVRANEARLTFSVTVIRPLVHAEAFALPDVWVVAKRTQQAGLEGLTPSGADLRLTWKVGNKTYATAGANGVVTGKAVGETTLTVKDGVSGLSAVAAIHICYPVTAVAFAEDTVVLSPGDTLQLTADVTMRTQSCVNHLVTFASSDAAIAEADPRTGLVRAVSFGEAIVTAEAENGISAACRVLVKGDGVLTLPAGLARIESQAFTGLYGISTVRVPAGVVSIAPDAFDPGTTLYVPNEAWRAWAVGHGYEAIVE